MFLFVAKLALQSPSWQLHSYMAKIVCSCHQKRKKYFYAFNKFLTRNPFFPYTAGFTNYRSVLCVLPLHQVNTKITKAKGTTNVMKKTVRLSNRALTK